MAVLLLFQQSQKWPISLLFALGGFAEQPGRDTHRANMSYQHFSLTRRVNYKQDLATPGTKAGLGLHLEDAAGGKARHWSNWDKA